MTMMSVHADGVVTLRTSDMKKVNDELDRLIKLRPKPKDIRVSWPRKRKDG